MALNLIPNPPTTLAVSGDWTTLLTRENASNLGTGLSIPIFTLTQWNSGTTIPAIAADSIIECGGSLYQADSDTALTLEGGIIDGTVHIKLIPSGEATPLTLTPTLTNDAIPAWDANKAGWYTGANKYLPYEMTKTSAVYTLKSEYRDQNKTIKYFTSGAITFNESLTYKFKYEASSTTRGAIFTALDPFLGASLNSPINFEGHYRQTTGSNPFAVIALFRASASAIAVILVSSTGAISTQSFTSGDGTNVPKILVNGNLDAYQY